VRVLGRDLQLTGRVGGVGVVRAPELVPNARVTEPADEHAFAVRTGEEGREEDVRFCLDERDREAAERVADDDVRRRDRGCVLRDTRGDVLARQVRRVDDMPAGLELRSHRVPQPAAAPRAVDEGEGRHATILPCA
jgi:hypothetical protein